MTSKTTTKALPAAKPPAALAVRIVFAMTTVGLVTSLARPPPEVRRSTTASVSDRSTFLSRIASASMAAWVPANGADAAIDVSTLRKELVAPTSTDVFLGGTYFANDDVASEAALEKIGRVKYTIRLEGLGSPLKEGRRAVTVAGRSSTISSRSDYYVELPGEIFPCPTEFEAANDDERHERRQCIAVDFSPAGGRKRVEGYWDVKEQGIRFISDGAVWSKE